MLKYSYLIQLPKPQGILFSLCPSDFSIVSAYDIVSFQWGVLGVCGHETILYLLEQTQQTVLFSLVILCLNVCTSLHVLFE